VRMAQWATGQGQRDDCALADWTDVRPLVDYGKRTGDLGVSAPRRGNDEFLLETAKIQKRVAPLQVP
jgi:hypothetical protein